MNGVELAMSSSTSAMASRTASIPSEPADRNEFLSLRPTCIFIRRCWLASTTPLPFAAAAKSNNPGYGREAPTIHPDGASTRTRSDTHAEGVNKSRGGRDERPPIHLAAAISGRPQ